MARKKIESNIASEQIEKIENKETVICEASEQEIKELENTEEKHKLDEIIKRYNIVLPDWMTAEQAKQYIANLHII